METKQLLFKNQSDKMIDSKTEKDTPSILRSLSKNAVPRFFAFFLAICSLVVTQNAAAQVSAYTKSNTAGTYTAHSGTVIRTAVDDGVSGVTNIGFTFMYAGTSFTQFVASSNGFIVLGSTAPATNNYTPLSTYANAIAAGSNDGEVTGDVRVEVQGSAPNRVCNIQYTNYDYDYNVTTRRGSFQIQLKETSNIVDIIYTQPTATTTTFAVRVGLSGNTTADFSNYQGSIANWAGLANGAANTSTVNFGSSNNGTRSRPSAGRILRWTPTVSSAPTSITGTNIICAGSSTTLTSAGGSLATDAVDLWSTSSCVDHVYFNPWRVNNFTAGANATTFNSVNGLLNVTSTSGDPFIHMPTLGSFDPNTYRYVNIRFRATSVAQPAGIEIFWYNTLYTGASGAQFKNQAVSSTQNVWTTVSIDMLTPTAGSWLHSNVTGWRFDWSTTTGVTMDIDFISLSNVPLVGSGSAITVTPATTTTYYTHKAGQTNITPCTSQTVTVGPQATAGTFQYANGSSQGICAGSTISCTNSTSPTNGGANTLSVVWYCGELLSGTPGAGGTYGAWVRSTTAATGLLAATGTNATALTNYNPQTDFPGKTNFLIIRRAYTNICGECAGVGGCLDQVFYVDINPLPSITLGSAASVCSGTTSSTLSYSATSNSPNQYMIDFDAAAEAEGFVDVAYTALPGSPIPLTIPGGAAPATYNGTVKVRVSGTGCESSTNAFTVTVNSNPTITLSAVSLVCSGSTSGSLPFSATTGSPNQYSITYDATALGQGFSNVGLTALPASPVGLVVPGAAADDTYNATITVKNTSTGCLSSATGFTIPLGPCLTPTMTTFSPTSACAQSGTSITVTGTNLAGSSVTVNGEAASVTASSGTSVTFDLPATASGTGDIVVTNLSGSVSSSTIPLSFTVNPLPTVTGTLSACIGSTSTLSGSATAAVVSPWVSADAGIATVTSGGVVSPVSEGTVDITYTNTNGCQRVVSFASNALPAISVQPSNPVSVCAGSGTPSFTVTATGTSLTYQWQEFISSWNNVSNGGVYSGALTSTLTITAPGAGMNNYRYRCIVSGACSPSATTDGLATLSVYAAPAISVQPANPSAICSGAGTAAFNVTATGSSLTYQWQEFISGWNNVSNGGVYSGVSTATLTLTNPLVAMNGYKYRCIVSNGICSSATTDGLATLSINALPTIGGTLSACMLSSSTLTGSGTPHGVTPWSSSNTGVATVTSGGVVTGVVGGTSTITYTNNLGCQRTATFTVNASTTPTSVTATPALVCNGFTTNLNATSAGNSIVWYTVASGGTSIGTSISAANFNTTPAASSTTTYYAEANPSVAAGSVSFTSGSGTWTVPAGVTSVNMEIWGGGGGGGGSNSNTSGGGGGGGGYSYVSISTTPGGSYSYSVGAGGAAGGTAYSDAAGTGGTTTVTGAGLSSFQATGGVGGKNGTASATNGAIGANGVGSGGSINRNGGSGGLGCYSCSMNWGGGGGGGGGNGSNGTTPATATGVANGGAGGSVGSGTAGGAGGSGWYGTYNNPGPGYAGNAPGGGGGGAGMYNTGTPFVGGAGGNGQIKISWNAVAGCPSVRVPVVVTTTAPVPGTVTGAPASIASGSNVTYTATGFSGGTFSKFQYQWNTTAGAWTDWGLTNPYTWTAGGTGNTLYVRSAIIDINGCFAYSPAVSTFITSQYIGNTATSGSTPATAPACGGWSSTWCAGSGTFTPLTLVQDINYTVENTGSGCTPAMATAYLQAWYTGGTDCTGWGVIGTLGNNTISFNAQISGVHRINVSSSVNVDNNTSCAFAKGWDGPGGASATLRYRQNTTVSNTTSSAAICLSDTKSLTATLGGGHNNPTINWSIVSGGGSISGTTYTPGGAGSVTVRATVGVCTSDVTFTVSPDRTVAAASATPFACNGVAMTDVTHVTTGVTGIASSSGLPPGVSASYSANTITIGGTPTTDGVYNYTITPTGCGTATATGTITVITTADPGSVASATSATLAVGDLLWTGNTTSVWGLNVNWYAFDGTDFVIPGGIPTSSNRVFILPSSTSGICISPFNNTTVTASGSASDVFIGSGATMIIDPSQTLDVNGNWVNNGTFTPDASATVNFTGSTAQSIGGSSAISFTNMTLNKSAGTLTLNKPVTVSGTLTMTTGKIATSGANLLTVGTSPAAPGSIAWTDGTVVGPLRRYFSGTASGTVASGIFPVGLSTVNRYAQVNYTGGLSTGGTITAEYKAGVCPVLYAGLPNTVNGQMIQNYENEGYWEITPSGGDLNTATYSLILRGNTLSSVTSLAFMSKLRIIKSTSHTSWEMSGIGSNSGTSGGISDFTIANTGMTGFSFFNIGSGNGNPLPVNLVDFAASCNDKATVDVKWSTASEQNSQNFVIERSRDLTQWEFLTEIDAAGNSNYLIAYASTDVDPFNGVSYYRLVQVDNNGVETIYGPISVSCTDVNNNMIVFPNPTKGNFTVEISSDENISNAEIQITDLTGKVLNQRIANVLEGKNQFTFEGLELQLGTYIINLNTGNGKINPVRVVVN